MVTAVNDVANNGGVRAVSRTRSRALLAVASALAAISASFIGALPANAFSGSGFHSSIESDRASGYGLIVGDVRPCTAKRFDAQPDEPLIVILTRNGKTYVTYNVSADAGTTWYHFDVPIGRYSVSTTWWGSKDYNVLVRFGKTSRVNMEVSCGTFST